MLEQPSDNPYAAPQAELQTTPSRKPVAARVSLRLWLIVFLINVPLPLVIGLQRCDRRGLWGMMAMIALLLVLSSWLVLRKPFFGVRLIPGGVILAISQMLPFVHLLLYAAGNFLVEALRLYTLPPPVDMTDAGGEYDFFPDYPPSAIIFLTLFIGVSLMLVALLLGSLPIFADRGEMSEEEVANERAKKHKSQREAQ